MGVELAKKLPTLAAIAALTVLGADAIGAQRDGYLTAVIVGAIAGLGGFYLNDLIRRVNDSVRGGRTRDR